MAVTLVVILELGEEVGTKRRYFCCTSFFPNLEVPETFSHQFETHNKVCGSVTPVILSSSATSPDCRPLCYVGRHTTKLPIWDIR